MIEIVARLLNDAHVFLAGDFVHCLISFTNTAPKNNRNTTSDVLAWSSVQIQCQCFTSDAKSSSNSSIDNGKSVVNSSNAYFGQNTALGTAVDGNNVRIELSTKPRILFCDLGIAPGETKTFAYKERLPGDAPPTYRGQLIKYAYKIMVAVQRITQPIRMLKIPIRVLPAMLPHLTDDTQCCETIDDLTPVNPFAEHRYKESEVSLLQMVTSRRSPSHYAIGNHRGRVARFSIFKQSYRLGEDIVGCFDFRLATVPCVQLSCALQCVETMITDKQQTKQERYVTVAKRHEVTLGLKCVQLVLPIPLHVTPDFATKLMRLNWRLHFEFVTTDSGANLEPQMIGDNCSNSVQWQAPSDLPIETMVWAMPVRLYATVPMHVEQGVRSSMLNRLTMA